MKIVLAASFCFGVKLLVRSPPPFRENTPDLVVYPACWGRKLSVLRGVLLVLFNYSLVSPCVPWGPPLSQAVCQGKAIRKCCPSIFFSFFSFSVSFSSFRRSHLLVFGSGSVVMVSCGPPPPESAGFVQAHRGGGSRRHKFKRDLTILRFYLPLKQNLTNSQPCLC